MNLALTLPASPPRAWPTRLFWALAGTVAWGVLLTAAWLQPDARGYGTHQQLGLPPCMFEAFTHIPCPGCGLTTSFAYMAHGRVFSAFGAHLMGPELFLMTLAVALASPWAVRRALPVLWVLSLPGTTVALSVTLFAGMVTLAWRLAHHFL